MYWENLTLFKRDLEIKNTAEKAEKRWKNVELLRKKRAKNYGKRWLGLVLSHFVYSFRPPIIPFQVQGVLRGLTTNLKPSNDFKAKIPEAFAVAGGHPINGVHKRLFPHWTKIRIASDRMTSPKKQQLGWNSNSTIRTVYFYRLLSMLLLWGNLSERLWKIRDSCWLKVWLPGFESVSPSQLFISLTLLGIHFTQNWSHFRTPGRLL